MSASSKKKLRKELEAAALTEKQLKQQADAKKLKIQSIAFITAMILVACIAIGTIAYTNINKTGIFQRNTVAVTINDHELTSVDLGYYYIDAINKAYSDWYASYGQSTLYALQMMMGLDLSAPLDSQPYPDDSGDTWADFFISLAIQNAKGTYAMYDAAVAEGFEMSEEERAIHEDNISLFQDYADLFYGGDVDKYVAASYGVGADLESYRAYVNVVSTANAYQQRYYDALEYDEAAIREYETGRYDDYTGYTYAYKYISANDYIHNGTEGADHDHASHTAEEIQAALDQAKLAAESVLSATSVEEFDKMISELEVYAVAEGETANAVISEKANDVLRPSILSALRDWVSAAERKEGDTVALPYIVETTAEDGTTTETTDGYFAVFYQSKDEHLDYLANVHRILFKFEGGTSGADGTVTYTVEEKNAAKVKAEALLEQWNQGEKTAASFAALAEEHSKETSVESGLYEDITPASSHEEYFLKWAEDAQRQAGDIEVVETDAGYAVLYYVGDSEITYRDYLLTLDLKGDAYDKWVASLEENVTVVDGNTRHMHRDYIPYNTTSY